MNYEQLNPNIPFMADSRVYERTIYVECTHMKLKLIHRFIKHKSTHGLVMFVCNLSVHKSKHVTLLRMLDWSHGMPNLLDYSVLICHNSALN